MGQILENLGIIDAHLKPIFLKITPRTEITITFYPGCVIFSKNKLGRFYYSLILEGEIIGF